MASRVGVWRPTTRRSPRDRPWRLTLGLSGADCVRGGDGSRWVVMSSAWT